MALSTIIVTGGAGFIGSSVARLLVRLGNYRVVVVDKLTYAGSRESVEEASASVNFRFVKADVANGDTMRAILKEHQPDTIVHLAAETHVDRSIVEAEHFLHSNVVGTFALLQESLRYWQQLESDRQEKFRLLLVSTDEVYGELPDSGKFSETSPYNPSSPYSATKAAADHLGRAWQRTFGLPVIITNCSNNYGPFQYPEKLIPVVITSALKRQPIPVYGRGENVRDWLFVDDHARALIDVARGGKPGETYVVGGDCERKNIEVVKTICEIMGDLVPGFDYKSLIEFVDDRPGHDWRYAIDASKIKSEIGWKPQVSFADGLRDTVAWYIDNEEWCRKALDRKRKWLTDKGRTDD